MKKKTSEINSINKTFDLSKEQYVRTLESNRDLSDKMEKEKEQSEKLQELISKQEKKLQSAKEENNKLQMQIDALELVVKNRAINAEYIVEKDRNNGWCTPGFTKKLGTTSTVGQIKVRCDGNKTGMKNTMNPLITDWK